MAQRTGADDLIAPPLKTKSAAGIAALLVAAVFAFSGCGGDSDTEGASTSRPSTAAEQAANTTAPADPSSSPGSAQGQEGGDQSASSPTPSSSSPGSGGKKGPSIVLPEGTPEPGPTPAERAEATIANISLQSPALGAAPEGTAALPSTYTCDGKDSWPELSWTGIPQGTEELALFAMNSQPVNGKLFFDWAVAGIDPSLEGLKAGQLPQGAVQGKNGFGQNGYSICPSQGQPETYIFALYALPKRLPASKGFDPFALRTQILEVSGNVGLLAVSYAR